MRRREALQTLGVAVLGSASGCTAILGGGTGDGGDGNRKRSGNLESMEIKGPEKGNDGNLVVVVAVKNKGEKKTSAKLEVTVTLGETVHVGNEKASIPGGERQDVRVAFDMKYTKWERASSRSIDVNLK